MEGDTLHPVSPIAGCFHVSYVETMSKCTKLVVDESIVERVFVIIHQSNAIYQASANEGAPSINPSSEGSETVLLKITDDPDVWMILEKGDHAVQPPRALEQDIVVEGEIEDGVCLA
jgi:hypothetical protein